MPQGYRRSRGGIAAGRSRAEQQCSGAAFDLRSCRAAAGATVGLHVDPSRRYCTLQRSCRRIPGSGSRRRARRSRLEPTGSREVRDGSGRSCDLWSTSGLGGPSRQRRELDMGLDLNRVVFKTDVITVPLDYEAAAPGWNGNGGPR